MGRAQFCQRTGLRKGAWTAEEDVKLISYIQRYGHGNWRELPKQAGLWRCGKSCRLRWTNYLRPDIKRGNFSGEEVKTIFRLHELLGNRWSAIAKKLPGRTDNEIKNVWNTNLKKRLNPNHSSSMKKMEEPAEMTMVKDDLACKDDDDHVGYLDDAFWDVEDDFDIDFLVKLVEEIDDELPPVVIT